MKNVSVIYQGGSGGFLLFYYLLLGQQYRTGININDCAIGQDPAEVQQLINKQFPKNLQQHRNNWKLQEFWPDNHWANVSCADPKLFLFCNPYYLLKAEEASLLNDSFKILLFTDTKLQLRLAWEKRAYWFNSHFYQNLFEDAPGASSVGREYIRWIIRQGQFDPQLDYIKRYYSPDLEVRLEEFVNTYNLPGFPKPNQLQINFVDYWISLQSRKAQQLLKRVGGP